jgi:hypothetical protein
MAGRAFCVSLPSAHQRMKRRWPGRPKQAPGHDDIAMVKFNASWYNSKRNQFNLSFMPQNSAVQHDELRPAARQIGDERLG